MKKRVYKGNFKLNCVKQILKGTYSLNYISKIRNVPKSTLHKWIKLYPIYGTEFVIPKKRGPKEKELNPKFVSLVIRLWNENKIGVPKLLFLLKESGFGVSQRQIQKILNKNKLRMNKRKRPEQISFVKYERQKKDELWHTDWSKCPFTGKNIIIFIDDYSRYVIHAEIFEHATLDNTLLAFRNAISKAGKSEQILSDNGVQFTNTKERGDPNHKFTKFCTENNIKHILGRIHHPQTNGKCERWFGTYKSEFDERFNYLDEFISFYNEKRIHQGINYQVPAERYIDEFKRSPIMV